MNDHTPDIAVVIVNWERPDDTLECIQSVMEETQFKLQVILVDNGSRDNSVERVKSMFPGVTVVQLPENLGFARGYNEGIRQALLTGAPNVLLLNNDTIVLPNAIRELCSAPWDVSVPRILFHHDPGLVWAAGCSWRRFPPSVVMRGYRKKDGPAYDRPDALEYATGCALLVKRTVLDIVEGFDPAFTNYMEDYEFSYRVRQSGFSIGYAPKARILHKVSQTIGSNTPLRWQHQGRNTVLFYRKDRRFSVYTLYAYLAWFTVRETLKGNIKILPAFWKGVQEGMQVVSSEERG